MIRAACNKCQTAILIDTDTGHRFDAATEQGHVCKQNGKKEFIPGQYSSEQLREMQRNELTGYCAVCNRRFNDYHSGFLHMLSEEGHSVQAVKR